MINVKNAADEKAQDKALKIYQRAKAKAHQQLAKKLKSKKVSLAEGFKKLNYFFSEADLKQFLSQNMRK